MKYFKTIIANIRGIDQSRSVMRKFGLLLGGVLFLLSVMILFKHRHEDVVTTATIVFAGLAVLSILVAIIVPEFLRPLNSIMLFIGMIIGSIVTQIILILVFFLVFTPISLIMKIAGKDAMHRVPDEKKKTYWMERQVEKYSPERSRRLF